MPRSDYMKPRVPIGKVDTDHARGPLGPFLRLLSGYEPLRNRKYEWFWNRYEIYSEIENEVTRQCRLNLISKKNV